MPAVKAILVPGSSTQIHSPPVHRATPGPWHTAATRTASALALGSLPSGENSDLVGVIVLSHSPRTPRQPYVTNQLLTTAPPSCPSTAPPRTFLGPLCPTVLPPEPPSRCPGNAGVPWGCVLGPLSPLCTHSCGVTCGLEVPAPSTTLV